MPLAKIQVVEGRYHETWITKVLGAVQAASMNTIRLPPEDFYQLVFEFPKERFLHTASFVGTPVALCAAKARGNRIGRGGDEACFMRSQQQ